jgi:putative tRNA adenosine deaminase-associated protein
VTYFAAALAKTDDGWTGRELDLHEVTDLESLAEELRDLVEENGQVGGPALMLLEEDDEYVGVVRVDAGDLDEPRVFLSDRRAVQASDVAAMLWEESDVDVDEAEDDEDEGTRPVAEPVGDPALLADLGTPSHVLLELCAEEGLLPADVLTGIAERAGFLEVLDSLRDG